MNGREAAEHDIEVLGQEPGLIRLNYEDPNGKTGRTWYQNIDPCPQAEFLVTACDEYPFFSTEQGGPLMNLRPTAALPGLKVISWGHNSSQGASLRVFYDKCNMTTRTPVAGQNSQGGDQFIALPLPASIPVLSISNLCNGKAGSRP